jgi:hypothetical protein
MASTGKTKVTLYRGSDTVSASGDTVGGFITVANLMHEVVIKMVESGGFKVVFASTNDTQLKTVKWGTLAMNAGSTALEWTKPDEPPKVGAPIQGATLSDGPTASITLESTAVTNSLAGPTAIPGSTSTPPANYPLQPWRVKFELLNTECVASYVATPLQLPGYWFYDGSYATPGGTLGTKAMLPDEWGFPGTNSRLVNPTNGIPLDAAGAIGSQEISSTIKMVTKVVIGSVGTDFAVGDYLIENQYGIASAATGTGFTYVVAAPLPPLPNRFPAIFRVESIDVGTVAAGSPVPTTGKIKSLKIVVPGKYPSAVSGPSAATGTVALDILASAGGAGPVTALLTLSTNCSGLDETDVRQGLYNRGNIVGANGASYPLTYELAISNSGFFLGIYESSWSTQIGGTAFAIGSPNTPGRFNWMVVQRPVNRENGEILDDVESATSKHPVFCVNGVAGLYYQFVVREKDIAHPTAGPEDHKVITYYDANSLTLGTLVSKYTNTNYGSALGYTGSAASPWDDYKYRVPAVLNSEDNHLLFNPQNQISLTEDKKYLVSFPHNISTPRFRYTEELDLIGLTSSDVLMAGQVITINTYGETTGTPPVITAREYIALPPSGRYNTGLRICVVKKTPRGAL